MNKQMKIVLSLGALILLTLVFGRWGAASTPAEALEPTVIVKNNPTSIPPTTVPTEESVPEENGQFIGLVYPPLPDDLSTGFSMIIQGSDDNGLSFVSDDGSRMLWLEKIARYEANGGVIWEVTDVLDLSKIESDAVLIPDGCSLNGSVDNEIVVVAQNGVILFAWRANATSDRFEVLAPKDITCDSDKAMRFE